MSDSLRQGASESIVKALQVLERVYRHVEQILDTVASRLHTDLGLEQAGILSEYKGTDEGRLRLRRYEGRYLARDRAVWRAAQPDLDQLRQPILFVCAVTKPADPAKVGGMCILGGTLAEFTILAGKALKGRNPDQYLPHLFEALMKEAPSLGDQSMEHDLETRHVSGKVRYIGTRLVDLPDEAGATAFAEEIARLWPGRERLAAPR